MPRDERRMTFIVVPHGGGDLSTRSFEVSYRRLRVAALLAGVAVLIWLLTLFSWGLVAAQAARVPVLERRIARLERENAQVQELARTLEAMERRYAQVRVLLGADTARISRRGGSGADAGEAGGGAPDSVEASVPAAWPLDQKGYVTRGHLARVQGRHPGIDIAVREGSRVHASGAGTVVEVGEDSVYGSFVRLRHPEGYESMYGHLSRVLVTEGVRVARDQVIALSGNTGLSTAPHLHFEIRKNGEPIDPRSLVQVPR